MSTDKVGKKGDVLLEMKDVVIDGFSDDRWHEIIKKVDLTVKRGEVVGIIAAVEHQLAIPDLDEPVGHPGDEIAVVAHQQGRTLIFDQRVFQHLLGWNIKVIGGFIQN
mgnify:CR=1 FL=1